MNPDRSAIDADLNAYIDGEIGSEERAAFEARVADDADLAGRIATYRADGDRLRAALDPVLDEPVPARLLEGLEAGAARGRFHLLLQAAAAVALFVLGAAAGWGLAVRFAEPQAGLAQTSERALQAHMVYVSEVRHPVEVAADEKEHLVAWLSKRLGHSLPAPDLTADGFRLIGGRLLPGEDGAAAQFMYEDPTGLRATLYVALNPEGRQTAFRLAQRGSTRMFYWLDGPFGYAITADVGEERLLRLARAVYDQTSGAAAAGG